MAINYAGYNPYPQYVNPTSIYQPTPVLTPTPPTPSSSFVWVQGEAGAKSYPVAPGNRVALFDSENPVVYIKSTDSTGRPSNMEIYDLVKRTEQTNATTETVDLSSYVTRDEIESILSALVSKEVDRAISEISLKPASKRKNGDDE